MTAARSSYALVTGIGVLLWSLPHPASINTRAWHLLAIFVATIAGIIAKPLPMGATALTSVAVVLATRTLTITETLSAFSNATVWLVLAAFLLAAGFTKTGLGTRVVYHLVWRNSPAARWGSPTASSPPTCCSPRQSPATPPGPAG